jgi:hypothetical protein
VTVVAAMRPTLVAALRPTLIAALRPTLIAAFRPTLIAALRPTLIAALRPGDPCPGHPPTVRPAVRTGQARGPSSRLGVRRAVDRRGAKA